MRHSVENPNTDFSDHYSANFKACWIKGLLNLAVPRTCSFVSATVAAPAAPKVVKV